MNSSHPCCGNWICLPNTNSHTTAHCMLIYTQYVASVFTRPSEYQTVSNSCVPAVHQTFMQVLMNKFILWYNHQASVMTCRLLVDAVWQRKQQRPTNNDNAASAKIITLNRRQNVIQSERDERHQLQRTSSTSNNNNNNALNHHKLIAMHSDTCRACTHRSHDSNTQIDQLIQQLYQSTPTIMTLVPPADRLMRRRSRTAFDLYEHANGETDKHSTTQQRYRNRPPPPLVKNASLALGMGTMTHQSSTVPIMDRLRSALGTAGVHDLVTVFRPPVWMGTMRVCHPWGYHTSRVSHHCLLTCTFSVCARACNIAYVRLCETRSDLVACGLMANRRYPYMHVSSTACASTIWWPHEFTQQLLLSQSTR